MVKHLFQGFLVYFSVILVTESQVIGFYSTLTSISSASAPLSAFWIMKICQMSGWVVYGQETRHTSLIMCAYGLMLMSRISIKMLGMLIFQHCVSHILLVLVKVGEFLSHEVRTTRYEYQNQRLQFFFKKLFDVRKYLFTIFPFF